MSITSCLYFAIEFIAIFIRINLSSTIFESEHFTRLTEELRKLIQQKIVITPTYQIFSAETQNSCPGML